jgi:16S rRNA (uracil1498-N3)-methyltransferase
MIRVMAAGPLEPGQSRLRLDARESRHLGVRRAGSGLAIEVLDGRGGVGTGWLRVDPPEDWVELERVVRLPPPAELVLLVGAGDRDRFYWLIEKAQELGVTRVVPVVSEHARSVATRLREEHLERAVRRAIDAMKQSGNPWLLAVDPPTELRAALERTAAPLRWLADRDGHPPGAMRLGDGVAVLVGPEGGLTDSERDTALASRFEPVRLGPHRLRFETAALAAASVVTALRGELP